jgi:hypothetical protein
MKTLSILVSTAALTLASAAAFADFNTDARTGAVTCKSGSMKVKINAKRSQIQVISGFDPGHPDTYDVVNRDSDGDTEVSYETQGNDVILTFSDRGDEIYFRDSGQHIPLTCPQ